LKDLARQTIICKTKQTPYKLANAPLLLDKAETFHQVHLHLYKPTGTPGNTNQVPYQLHLANQAKLNSYTALNYRRMVAKTLSQLALALVLVILTSTRPDA